MRTPIWIPLVVAALGVLGTVTAGIVGVLITQRRADRREEKIWERERQREREHWTREGTARTFEQRQRAYVNYFKSIRALHDRGWNCGLKPPVSSSDLAM